MFDPWQVARCLFQTHGLAIDMKTVGRKKWGALVRKHLSQESLDGVTGILGKLPAAGPIRIRYDDFKRLHAHAHSIGKDGREEAATEILLFLHELERLSAADAESEERNIKDVPTDDHGTGGGRHIVRGTKYLT
jgi:hypothetical protein